MAFSNFEDRIASTTVELSTGTNTGVFTTPLRASAESASTETAGSDAASQALSAPSTFRTSTSAISSGQYTCSRRSARDSMAKTKQVISQTPLPPRWPLEYRKPALETLLYLTSPPPTSTACPMARSQPRSSCPFSPPWPSLHYSFSADDGGETETPRRSLSSPP